MVMAPVVDGSGADGQEFHCLLGAEGGIGHPFSVVCSGDDDCHTAFSQGVLSQGDLGLIVMTFLGSDFGSRIRRQPCG